MELEHEIEQDNQVYTLEPETDGETAAVPAALETDATASMLAQLEQLQDAEPEEKPDGTEEEQEEPKPLSTAEKRMAAKVTASFIAGSTAEGVEFFLKPVKVDESTRETFADRLAAVLEKHDGEMPPWLARLIADWKEEFALARFMVATGWEIRRQYKAEQARTLHIVKAPEHPATPEKRRIRVQAGV